MVKKNFRNLLLQNERWTLNLVYRLEYPSTTKIVPMMTFDDLDLFYENVKYGKMLIHRSHKDFEECGLHVGN